MQSIPNEVLRCVLKKLNYIERKAVCRVAKMFWYLIKTLQKDMQQYTLTEISYEDSCYQIPVGWSTLGHLKAINEKYIIFAYCHDDFVGVLRPNHIIETMCRFYISHDQRLRYCPKGTTNLVARFLPKETPIPNIYMYPYRYACKNPHDIYIPLHKDSKEGSVKLKMYGYCGFSKDSRIIIYYIHSQEHLDEFIKAHNAEKIQPNDMVYYHTTFETLKEDCYDRLYHFDTKDGEKIIWPYAYDYL